MERVFGYNFAELSKPGHVLMTTQQEIVSEKGTKYVITKDLVVGNMGNVKLSSTDIHCIQYESHRLGKGAGLEQSIIYRAKTGQMVLIFDTDHLNYPYLAYLHTTGVIRKPLNFIHVDAHIDLNNLPYYAPKLPLFRFFDNFDKVKDYFRGYVKDYNFVTALAAARYINGFSCISHTSMVDVFESRNYYTVLNEYGIQARHLYPQEFNRYFLIYDHPGVNMLAIDLDFFGYSFDKYHPDNLSPSNRAHKFCDNLIYGGYHSSQTPVVCIATSPGYNDGYQSEEEKLEVLNILINRLKLN